MILTLAPDMYLTPEEVIALMRSSQRRLAPVPDKERELVFRTEGLPSDKVAGAIRRLLKQIKDLVAARVKEYNEVSD